MHAETTLNRACHGLVRAAKSLSICHFSIEAAELVCYTLNTGLKGQKLLSINQNEINLHNFVRNQKGGIRTARHVY